MENLVLSLFKVKWLRVNLDLFCPEGRVINGETRFYYIFKVKRLRVNLYLFCPEGRVINGESRSIFI